MKPGLLNKKWFVITLHAVCWIVLFSLPFFLRTSYKNEHKQPQPDDNALFIFYFFSCVLLVILFYVCAFVLLPFVQRTKKTALFVLMNIAVLIIIYFLHWLYFSLFVTQMPFKPINFFLYNIFPYFFILASSTAYFFILDRQKIAALTQQRETENLKTELLFLRSQVSPHFMFNVLNNMVALARKKSDLLEPSLIKLSALMRYMLYETDEQKVPLEKEVEYLQSYIDLQRQRFGNYVKVNTLFEGLVSANEIEPMLLIPFVENAFKHGTGIIEQPEINISLKEENSLLEFKVSNKFNDEANKSKDKSSGIGLNNVKRRLNLLYGEKHSLYITNNDGWFTVVLDINLS